MKIPEENFIKGIKKKWLTEYNEFWWGDRLDSRFVALYSLKDIRNSYVLDIGCSSGFVLSEIDESNFKVGIDYNIKKLKKAKELYQKIYLIQADMHSLPFKKNAFDKVTSFHILQCSPSKKKAKCLKEIQKAMRKGGELILTVPNKSYPLYYKNNKCVTYSELLSLLEKFFRINIVKGFNPFPPFPYFLPNRLLARIPGIWKLLCFLMERNIFLKRCCSFYVESKK